ARLAARLCGSGRAGEALHAAAVLVRGELLLARAGKHAARVRERQVMAERQEYAVEGLAAPISHYGDAVGFGDVLFISGVAPVDAAGRVVSDDVAEQTRQVFRSMKLVLDAAGASFADILKVTV